MPGLDLTQPDTPELDTAQPEDLHSDSGRPGSIRAMLGQAIAGAANKSTAPSHDSEVVQPVESIAASSPESEVVQSAEPVAALSPESEVVQPAEVSTARVQPPGTSAARALQLRDGAGRPDMTPAGLPKKEEPTDWKGRWEGFKPFLPMVLGGIEGMTPEGRKRMHELQLAKLKHAADVEKSQKGGDAYKIAMRTKGTPESIDALQRWAAANPDAAKPYLKTGKLFTDFAGDDRALLSDTWNKTAGPAGRLAGSQEVRSATGVGNLALHTQERIPPGWKMRPGAVISIQAAREFSKRAGALAALSSHFDRLEELSREAQSAGGVKNFLRRLDPRDPLADQMNADISGALGQMNIVNATGDPSLAKIELALKELGGDPSRWLNYFSDIRRMTIVREAERNAKKNVSAGAENLGLVRLADDEVPEPFVFKKASEYKALPRAAASGKPEPSSTETPAIPDATALRAKADAAKARVEALKKKAGVQ